MRRSYWLLLVVALGLILPASAPGHGLVARADLPVPDWLFTFGAGAVVLVTFVGLAVAWRRPLLEDAGVRWLPDQLGRALTGRAIDLFAGALGIGLLALVVWAGFAGTTSPGANIAPTFVYVGFWLGLAAASVLLGDVFRLFNPWRAIGRVASWCTRSLDVPPAMGYPARLGYWPAAASIFLFAWLELVVADGDEPETLAVATLIYTVVQFVGMALYGVERWCERGEGFGVYFSLLARMSPWQREGRRLGLRAPLAGLASWTALPGSVALLAVLIGSTSFDGFSAGATWQDLAKDALDEIDGWGLGPVRSLELIYGAGLIASIVVLGGFFLAGAALTRRLSGGDEPVSVIARRYVHTLVPIAAAYIAAHYVSLLLFQGQALGFLLSDPLGRGSDVFGTAGWSIDYGVVAAETFWYLQVGFVVAGHVAALALAHDRALVDLREHVKATRSQYGMLGVMVGFTVLALWLLSEAAKG